MAFTTKTRYSMRWGYRTPIPSHTSARWPATTTANHTHNPHVGQQFPGQVAQCRLTNAESSCPSPYTRLRQVNLAFGEGGVWVALPLEGDYWYGDGPVDVWDYFVRLTRGKPFVDEVTHREQAACPCGKWAGRR
jgi:hypothetical protein